MINDRFLVKKKLGEGRSKVFLCSDSDLSEGQAKDVAIKVLPNGTDELEVQAFRNEFFTLRKLNHPNIIKANETGTIVKLDSNEHGLSEGCKFFALEYFDGKDILHFPSLKNPENLKEIITQICSVLYYLHQSNYIYYDLKVENILVAMIDDKPVIKLIDMGFAGHAQSGNELTIRGSAEYLAPEILKKESYDHRIDLYSLGILLYRILYDHFPFETANQLDIYKAHVENEFDFPQTDFFPGVVDVIKKLLKKDPSERYYNSLQVLTDLDIPVEKISSDLLPAKVFANRSEALSVLQNYILNDSGGEVYSVKGVEGSGKTSLIEEIFANYHNVILAGNSRSKSGIEYIKDLVKRIIYSDFVYAKLPKQTLELMTDFLQNNDQANIDRLKSIFTRLSSKANFIIAFDDFNNLDDFTIEIFKEIFPILQVNKIKIILTEDSGLNYLSGFIFNLQEINLTTFTEAHLDEFLNKSFAQFFPRDELKNLILLYADLLPGSIESFIEDLILLKILEFTSSGTEIKIDEESIALLKSSHDEIYKLRIDQLSGEELKTAQIISSLDISVEQGMISELVGLDVRNVLNILADLRHKNILQQASAVPIIASEGLKKYIYSTIENKPQFHRENALVLKDKFQEFNRSELARQFELAKDYNESYEVLKRELTQAEKLSAYTYQKKIIQHLQEFPLDEPIKIDLKLRLCKVFHKLNDPQSSLNLINELVSGNLDSEDLTEILILKGTCLIELGELEPGKQLFESLTPKISDMRRRQKLLVEIAYAEFDLNRYDVASQMCKEIISNEFTGDEEKGKCYNLLGLLDFYHKHNLDIALKQFQEALKFYKSSNLTLNAAKIEVNMGVMYNIKGDYENAEKHWNNSSQANMSIGNLDQEAKLLLNFGVFYYNKLNFEKAIQNYSKAYDIFLSLGNKNGQGIVLGNLGEIYLEICEYQKSLESLNKAKNIPAHFLKADELAEILFMLVKFYLAIADKEQLQQVLSDYKFLAEKNLLSEKYNLNLKYLELITLPDEMRNESYFDSFRDLLNTFKKEGEKRFWAEGSFIFCKYLINYGRYETACELLNNTEFTNICNENLFFKSERLYLLGLIASQYNSLELPPPIESLEEAYSLIKEQNITELTWKVLNALAENYFQRGNFKRAEDYLQYSKQLLNFIADNIQDENLKTKYLSKPERKSALEKLEYMESKL